MANGKDIENVVLLPSSSFEGLLFALREERAALEAEVDALRTELLGVRVFSTARQQAPHPESGHAARDVAGCQVGLRTLESLEPVPTEIAPLGHEMSSVESVNMEIVATFSEATSESSKHVAVTHGSEKPHGTRTSVDTAGVEKVVATHSQVLAEALHAQKGRDTVLGDSLAEIRHVRAGLRRSASVTAVRIQSRWTRYQTILRQVTESIRFDLFFGALILINALFMAVETDVTLARGNESKPDSFHKIGLCFTMSFCVELAIRMAADFRGFFFKCHLWNYFDVVLVVMALLEEILSRAGNLANMRLIRLLRLARAAKILRMARIVRLVGGLRTLVYSLVGTLRQVLWAFMLIFCLMFIFAVCVGQVVAEALIVSHGEDTDQLLRKYFGSVSQCMVTVYMAVTGGVSWIECIEPLEEVGTTVFVGFLMYIALIQWVVLNVVTGTFCESAAAAARKNVSLSMQNYRENRDEFMKRAKTIFKTIDLDGSGSLRIVDMKPFLDQEPARALFGALDLDIGDVQDLFAVLDEDGTQTIDLEEFVFGCLRLRGAAKALDVAKLHYRWLLESSLDVGVLDAC
eukprot:TRINITY_DN29461_c0_g1_i4.p1 TRINITY_DN29461_c0_g1~~TRINITY_DN29461_c0_g1_i4.p1  ORF type:complete len:575 (+),score=103.44 TRINITY_DN29461_c0_g1_i4:224-1948(+)